ncbi:probable penicillin-binding protein dacb1 (d-alanyl-d-alaninecarboxypeptidase) (dd-peptidase) (dd-carboxypeptidase) [Janibacter sp. HTCC2649]|uniref:D-alanyl-D-alanine carboxypeptidase family protein n=1 Tax=Janibacter sp. HTCC2649 TaxID=313589 RepID=UPI000067101D|nr:D-alanyl-D-alanine carboxypeptidase [Janibacter sp. HTCC2649]EAP97409.1 probable penicillin-binding protein dacb1 (d-alanyl-d-alaninecarboxypeptidase) (dd-peptidase) (dd-carboxypeptidase) [Janibacter sp. HTCC2649]
MRNVALAVTTTALVAAALTAAASPALATPNPSPTSPTPAPSVSASPALPRVPDLLDPELSVGGPRLAQMNSVIVDTPTGVPAPPDVSDVAWLIADADTGEILAAKNPHAHLLPASTLKTLTAIHLLPRLKPTAVRTATTLESNAEGTRVGMVAGGTYTAAQLFQALVMSSGNDAAYGLAELNGGLAKTVTELNGLAAELGAHDTVVADPSGLDSPGQYSSAYDLALFGRAAIANPAYLKLASTKTATFPAATSRSSRSRSSYAIGNHNRLLWNYPGTIGVKNGFTKAAHRTFIGAATRGGKTYIVTEMYGTGSSWRPAASLLDWAFAHGAVAKPVGRLVDRGEVPQAPTAAEPKAPAAQPAGEPDVAAALTSPTGDVTPSLLPLVGGAVLLALVLGTRGRRRRQRPGPASSGRHRT